MGCRVVVGDGLPLVSFPRKVHTFVARAETVPLRGTDPPNHPLVFVGGLEQFYFLLQHAIFGEEERRGLPGSGSGVGMVITGGAVGRKIFQ